MPAAVPRGWKGQAAAAGSALALLLVAASCVPASHHGASSGPAITLDDAFPALQFTSPIAMVQDPSDATRWYVVERGGTIRRFSTAAPTATTLYADLSGVVNITGEGGLLGMAFHPDYPSTPDVFLSYTTTSAPLRSHITRYPESGGLLDTASGTEVLTQEQPESNHDGGEILFGPDGKLYIGLGDGGGAGDMHGTIGNGQDTTVLLGKLLRIDVDAASPYGIPSDNPFVGSGTARQEIYAYGLRNPWRFSFDALTGDLWLADVGQDAWEEVDRIVSGGNYGWRVMEGFHCYNASTCSQGGLTLPVAEYDHSGGKCAVSGGFVYRGSQSPALQGRYIYADLCTGQIWTLPVGGGAPTLGLASGLEIVGFAEGADGEVYVLDFASGRILHVRSP